jgi:hypothetical protein
MVQTRKYWRTDGRTDARMTDEWRSQKLTLSLCDRWAKTIRTVQILQIEKPEKQTHNSQAHDVTVHRVLTARVLKIENTISI